MWCHAFGELLHELDLRLVSDQGQMAPGHELDRDRNLVPHLEHRQPFVRAEGTLSSAAFEAWMDAEHARGAGPRTRYFLTKDEDLIHIGDATFALSKGWRTNTVPSLRRLRDAFPQAAISFEPTAVEDDDDDTD